MTLPGVGVPSRRPEDTFCNPTEVIIGRGYDLHVFHCPQDYAHPPATTMQF
ncbi:hypothetical protein GCM10009682_59070 [Luedemannella flava]|uniref:Uncharacterized protein n=1 Tax=Luedemannella flava TaxID=349316 RepID=A0ABP4YW22_9ACTN